MRTNRQNLFYVIGVLLILLAAVGLTWAGHQIAAQPGVEDSFAPLWAGARLVITRQANPYDLDRITRTLWFTDSEPSRFVYPYYA